jgi:hypothetical protein
MGETGVSSKYPSPASSMYTGTILVAQAEPTQQSDKMDMLNKRFFNKEVRKIFMCCP